MQQINQPPMNPAEEKHKYIFPNLMAKMMKNVPMHVQLQSSMMASFLIMVGMLLMTIYLFAFTDQTMAFKILTLINIVGAFLFISSTLVTTYQQYVSYMDVMSLQMAMGQTNVGGMNLPIDDLKMHKYNRKNQVLFFGGLLLILFAFVPKEWLWTLVPTLQSFEYWILGLLILVGIALIYLAIKKPKQKKALVQKPRPIMQKTAQRPIQPNQSNQPIPRRENIPVPVQRPVNRSIIPPQRQVPAQRPVQVPPRQVQMAPRPVQVPRPAPVQQPQAVRTQIQRPMPAQRPVQSQVQPKINFKPQPKVEHPAVEELKQPPKQSIFSRFKSNKKVTKEDKMMKDIESTLNEKLYEINRLKSKQV